MELINIEPTDNTPGVLMDADKHTIKLWGESRPEQVQQFYKPLLEWMEEYKKHAHYIKDQTKTKLSFQFIFDLEYFNSSTAKYLMDMIFKLKAYKEQGIEINVVWEYDKEDIDNLEAGEEFEELLDVKFTYHPK